MNLTSKFLRGDPRSVKAKKNILASGIFKVSDVLVYLVLVPVTLGYLNEYEYGIWLTLNSLLMWINSMDIGLGNGLRNNLATAIAHEDKDLGRTYVSTAFFIIACLTIIIVAVVTALFSLVNWYDLLGTTVEQVPNLEEVILTSFIFFSVGFVMKLVGSVYLAMQLPAVNNLLQLLGHIVSLVVIYALTLTTQGSLLFVAIAYSAASPLIYFCAYPITFYKVFDFLRPSVHYIKFSYIKDLLSLSIEFFILQMAGIVLFSITNILISHMFGPAEVTPYNLSQKYLSLVMIGINIILAPIWSATTDAYERNDIEWVKRSVKTVHKVNIAATLLLVIMVAVSPIVYHLWIGEAVNIPLVLTAFMALYQCIILWSLGYSTFLNGFGKLRLQSYNIIFQAVIFIPICYLLASSMGVLGIVIGMCIVNMTGLVINKLQLQKLLENRGTGLWNK